MKTFKNYQEAFQWLITEGMSKVEFQTTSGHSKDQIIIYTGLFRWEDGTIRTEKEPSTFAELAAFNIRNNK